MYLWCRSKAKIIIAKYDCIISLSCRIRHRKKQRQTRVSVVYKNQIHSILIGSAYLGRSSNHSSWLHLNPSRGKMLKHTRPQNVILTNYLKFMHDICTVLNCAWLEAQMPSRENLIGNCNDVLSQKNLWSFVFHFFFKHFARNLHKMSTIHRFFFSSKSNPVRKQSTTFHSDDFWIKSHI